jgi:hypothetical protein
MDIYYLEIGSLEYLIETKGRIDPQSARAKWIAEGLAKALNKKFFDAVVEGELPGYELRATVGNLREGSLIADLLLHAHVLYTAGATAGVIIGFEKFLKDYPKIRMGVLQIAADVNFLVSKSRILLGKKFPAKLSYEEVATTAQIAVKVEQAIGAIHEKAEAKRAHDAAAHQQTRKRHGRPTAG